MSLFMNQFEILLAKNFKVIVRKRMIWCMNIVLPILISSLLLVARSYIKEETLQEVQEYPTLPTNNFNRITNNAANLGIHINWTLFYYPITEDLRLLMDRTALLINKHVSVVGLSSKADLEVHQFKYASQILGYVVFNNFDLRTSKIGRDLSYEIRLPGRPRFSNFSREVSWSTGTPGYAYMMSSIRNPRDADAGSMYYSEGFVLIQTAVTRAFCFLHNETLPEVYLKRFPIPEAVVDQLKVYIPVIIVVYALAFVLPTIGMTQLLARERKKQLRQIMKITGTPSWMHYSAWFTSFLVMQLFVVTAIICIHWFSGYSIFRFTDHMILWVLLMAFATSTIFLAFFISTVTSEPVLAAQLPLYMVIMGSVVMALVSYYLPKNRAAKFFFAILFNSNAFGYGFEVLFEFEYEEQGAIWNKFFTVEEDTNVSIAQMTYLLGLSSFIYLILTLYLEEILPGEYGVSRKWYFFLTRSFWYHRRSVLDHHPGRYDDEEGRANLTIPVESPPVDKEVGIRIRKLTKIYGDAAGRLEGEGKEAAVDNLTMNLYQGEITVLLGENGAGKTTLIMMLTGMVASTSGTVTVGQYEIGKQTKDIQKMIGFCPQHNVLFEDLTVGEHIVLFSRLKGKSMPQAKREMERYVAGLQLEEKLHSRVSTLSGGMKRKLCTGIAFAGGAPLVLFDEPTAGLDPRARRAIWDLMQTEKEERTIILSTHYMDEADLMGDRVALLNKGQLVCFGSPHFLKQIYPSGYRLIVVKEPGTNVDKISELIKEFLQSADIDMNIGSEISYVLPEKHLDIFPKLLFAVEENAANLGITGYGITSTTMEQVFLKANGVTYNKLPVLTYKDKLMLRQRGIIRKQMPIIPKVEGSELRRNQFYAMFVKYGIYNMRHYYITATNLMTPVVFLLMTLVSVRIIKERVIDHALWMSLTRVDLNTITLINADVRNNSVALHLAAFVNDIGLGHHTARFIPHEMGMFLYNFASVNMFFYTRHMAMAFSVAQNDNTTVWFNGQFGHSMAMGLQTVYDTFLKSKNLRLFCYNNPIPVAANEAFTSRQAIVAIASTPFAFGILVTLLYGTLIDKYIIERRNGFKFLQKINGVSSLAYWIPGIAIDYCIMIVSMLSCVLLLVMFQEPGMSTGSEMPRLLLLLFSFTFSLFPFMGLWSLVTTSHMAFQALNLFFGSLLGLLMAVFVLFHRIKAVTADQREYYETMERFMHFHPYFNFFTYLGKMMMIYYTNNVCQYSCKMNPECKGPDVMCDLSSMCCEVQYHSMKPYSTGLNFAGFMWSGLLYFGFFFLYESGLLTLVCGPLCMGLVTRQPPDDLKRKLDSDVVEEKIRINRMTYRQIRSQVLVLKNLTKYFREMLVVDDLCLGVKRGDCLGLLGVNGAGKSTVFRILIGEIRRSSGQGWIFGRTLNDNWQRIYKTIGYCPQVDEMPPNMTIREVMTMFCMLRGVPRSMVGPNCVMTAISFGFYEHIDKRIKNLSGGMRRKLSSAIALIGDTQLLLLDEPSTGMDPLARRGLWDALMRIRRAGRSIVFTSHNMEECEAISTKATIMVNGILQCMGTVQYLKTKFNRGFTAMLQMDMDVMTLRVLNQMKLFIRQSFEVVQLREDYGGRLLYEIKDQSKNWSEIFQVMETIKKKYPLENYTLTQTTLEQVFLSFADKQREK